MKKFPYLFFFAACCLAGSPFIEAAKAKSFKCQEDADIYLTSNYNQGCKYYNEQNYRKAYSHFEKVIYFFPNSEAAAEASYYLAVCYYQMKEYDFANREFSSYLTASAHPAFFEDAVRFKFCIAEHFKHGKKKRAFDSRYCPKWLSAEDEALQIYDEVIVALPNHELTVCALMSKAELLRRMREYRECIDTYQTLIRRFPRDETTPEAYVKIAETYCEQSQYEFQNPDILAFAELNARKFSEDFPRDEQVATVNGYVQRIKEIYAKGLCDLGLFYERKGHPHAAGIYYETSIAEFPNTDVADFCRARLATLDYSKERKDVVIPVSTLIEERDPLEFEEKATAAEGNFFESLPIAPALEADKPSEQERDQTINDILKDPNACEACEPVDVSMTTQNGFFDSFQSKESESYALANTEFVPTTVPAFSNAAALGYYDELSQMNDRQMISYSEDANRNFYDLSSSNSSHEVVTYQKSPHETQFDYFSEMTVPLVDSAYFQDFETGSESHLVKVPKEHYTNEPYPPSENDIYVEPYDVYDNPYVTIGHEDDNYVTFENGKTINHAQYACEEEPRRVFSIVRKKEPPPKIYAHYSLLKKRPVKRAYCQ